MFDSICVGRPGGAFDPAMLGFIAESLLFYGRVFVVVNHAGFESLARICGAETLSALLADGPLQLIFQENRLGVATETISGDAHHSFIAFHGKGYEAQHFVVKTIQELVGRSGAGRRLGNKICDRIDKRYFDPEKGFNWVDQISTTGDSDVLVKNILSVLAPGYPNDNVRFRVHKAGSRYVIDSSIDFESADKAYRSLATDDSHLTPAWILSHLYEGHANLVAAAEVASEIGADPLEAALARAQVEACIARANTGTEKLRSFQEVLLEAVAWEMRSLQVSETSMNYAN
jgi:hypothetical protein